MCSIFQLHPINFGDNLIEICGKLFTLTLQQFSFPSLQFLIGVLHLPFSANLQLPRVHIEQILATDGVRSSICDAALCTAVVLCQANRPGERYTKPGFRDVRQKHLCTLLTGARRKQLSHLVGSSKVTAASTAHLQRWASPVLSWVLYSHGSDPQLKTSSRSGAKTMTGTPSNWSPRKWNPSIVISFSQAVHALRRSPLQTMPAKKEWVTTRSSKASRTWSTRWRKELCFTALETFLCSFGRLFSGFFSIA